MRTITLEEHFATPAYIDGPGADIKKMPGVADKLINLGEKRLAEMNAAGIDMQVLSLNSPGTESLNNSDAKKFATESNDALAAAIKQYPTRFGGLAALPTGDPAASVAELKRCIDRGFVGANINGHVNGRYLDDEFFRPIFKSAQELNVPIYLHPTKPPKAVADVYYSGFSELVDDLFARAGYGWHIETGIHLLRLILGEVFDQFPRLQVIIGHLGESLPYMLERMDSVLSTERTKLQRSVKDYLANNVYYTISGFNHLAPFKCLVEEVGIGRIMFSADYPYGAMGEAKEFLDSLPISQGEKSQIAHGNAEALMGIKSL